MRGEPSSDRPTEPASTEQVADLAAEVDRLRAERDRLAEESAVLDRRVHGGRPRRALVGALVVLSCLSFLVASLAFWANRNVLETDVFVDRVAPTVQDPAVQAALATAITDQVMRLVDVEDLFASALPERGQVLALPLSAAVREFVHDRVLGFVASDRFHDLWADVLERSHRRAVGVLRGEGGPMIATAEGTVTLNLIPLVDEVLRRISEVSPQFFGRTIDIPELTVDDLPDAARARIGDALGVEVDDDFGVVTLFESDQLSATQDAIALFDRLLPVAIVLTVALVAAALIVSRRRRRTGLQLLVGFAVVVVLVRRLALRVTDDVLDLVRVSENREAVEVSFRAFLDPLLASTGWILIALLAGMVVLVATGPYRWVVAGRDGVVRLARGASAVAGDVATQDTTVAWVERNATALYSGGAVAAVAVLWWLDLSWLGLLVALAFIGAVELFVYRVASRDDQRPGPGVMPPSGGPAGGPVG